MFNQNTDNVHFSLSEYQRYSRQLILSQLQEIGQKRLHEAKILCVGVGGLASSMLMYLASAGIGSITLVDSDEIDISNLQRQVIHNTISINTKKVDSASKFLLKLNPNCNINIIAENLDRTNVQKLISMHDLIIDGTDNFKIRYLIDEFCFLLSTPWIYGAAFQFEGQVSVFNYKGGPRYQDVYPVNMLEQASTSCDTVGILGVVTGMIGMIQATEALKIILGIGDIISGKLLLFDALKLKFKEIQIRHNLQYFSQNTLLNTKHSIEEDNIKKAIDVQELDKLIQNKAEFILVDVRSNIEHAIDKIPGAVNYPLTKLEEIDQINSLRNTNQQIILYCNLDSRSIIAGKMLNDQGLDFLRLKHGMYSWRKHKNNHILKRRERDSNPC